jgi:D-glycero-D-manno-heptose 1,7-bisphosphate phosphatase
MGNKVHLHIVSGRRIGSPHGRQIHLIIPLHRHCYDSEVTNAAGRADWTDVTTVFLDRDGVLNEKAPEGEYVHRWRDFRVLPGVPEALAKLNRAKLRVIVLSNQRGIALGLYTITQVEAIHAAFQHLLINHAARVDAFYFCPHDHGQCNCRKPLPGLFEQAAIDFPEIQAAHSVMIGDSLADIEFGNRLGMRTILVGGDAAQLLPKTEKAAQRADLRCASLSEAVEVLLEQKG